MGELVFRVSSELKNILGRDLITNDYIAILELVKTLMMQVQQKWRSLLHKIALQ